MARQASITPRATFNWVKCHEPDTKFNAEGVFSADMILDPANDPDHEAFIEKLDAMVEEAKAGFVAEDKKKKNWNTVSKVKPEIDEEGDETGRFIVKFSQKAVMASKKTGKTYTIKNIPVIDAGRNAVGKEVRIGNGSIGKVKFESRPYPSAKDKEIGITLDLKMFQLIQLNEFGVDTSGFGDEEGGYSASDSFEEFDGGNAANDVGAGDDF
jgi:Single-stranded DNA-binding protein, Bacteriophage T7